jgi:hypothetical protein
MNPKSSNLGSSYNHESDVTSCLRPTQQPPVYDSSTTHYSLRTLASRPPKDRIDDEFPTVREDNYTITRYYSKKTLFGYY